MDRYAYFLVAKQTLDEGLETERERYVVTLPTGSYELHPGIVIVIKTDVAGGKDGILVRLSKQKHIRVAPFADEFVAWQGDVGDRVALGALPIAYYRALYELVVEDVDSPTPYETKTVTVQMYEAMDPKPKIFKRKRKAAQ